MNVPVATTIIFIVIQAVAYSDLIEDQWNAFKSAHQKQYDNDDEEQYRMNVYQDNLNDILEHNKNFDLGLETYKLKENKFADLLHEEFNEILKGLSGTKHTLSNASSDGSSLDSATSNVDEPPESVDWRSKGAVTPVKDQGQCGSCWSFSTTGAVEAQHFFQTGQLVSLSEQNLIDCSGAYGNEGCGGGNIFFAYEYIIKANGIDTAESYPYVGTNNDCRYDPTNSGATITGSKEIKRGNEKQLQAAVANIGPVSAAINTNSRKFRFYSEGVYDDPNCGSSLYDLDHAILIVGYGTSDDGRDYWLVKNSWGKRWGQQGYILMSRNKNNQCGIATSASYPVV